MIRPVNLPTGRINGCYTTFLNKFVIYGGNLRFYGSGDFEDEDLSNELWIFENDNWKKKEVQVEHARRGSSTCIPSRDKKSLLVFGGKTVKDELSEEILKINFNSIESIRLESSNSACKRCYGHSSELPRLKEACGHDISYLNIKN